MLNRSIFWQSRLKAAGIHLAMSMALATLAALLVFYVWYPYPYRDISGGRDLFLLVVAVDVVMGPLLTFTVFNRAKPRQELVRDLGVIGLLQIAALLYGLWTVAMARPVYLVFEVSRFAVVHAIDVPRELLDKAPPELRQLPLWGPGMLSVRAFKNNAEQTDATMTALAGLAVAAQPNLWQSYANGRTQVLVSAKPLADLKARFPTRLPDIDKALQAIPPGKTVGYLPLVGRNTFWTVFVDMSSAEVLAFAPLDPF